MDIMIRILKLLIENNSKQFSIFEISKILKLDYKQTFVKIKKLEREKLINLKKIGNTNQIIFNFKFAPEVLEIETLRKNEILNNKNLKVILKRLEDFKNPFSCLILFGSYAKKTNTKNSDIDLCLISDNELFNKEVEKSLNSIPLDIQLLTFTTNEFKSMLNSKKIDVSDEIIKNNIILKGVENFYSLIENFKNE
jgi:predicted nucleotidyltransferase